MFKLLGTSRTQVREAWGWIFGTFQSFFPLEKSVYRSAVEKLPLLKIVKAPAGCDQKIDCGLGIDGETKKLARQGDPGMGTDWKKISMNMSTMQIKCQMTVSTFASLVCSWLVQTEKWFAHLLHAKTHQTPKKAAENWTPPAASA